MMENPFMSIIPREEEKAVGVNKQQIKELLNKNKGKWTVFIVSGEYGSGKSLVISEIEKQIKGAKIEKIIYSREMGSGIRALREKKKIVVEIDKFELSETTKDETLRVLLDTVANVSEGGVTFIISVTPKTLSRLFSLSQKFKNTSIVYNMPPLSYEEAREMVVSRLNEVRNKDSASIEPFTDAELKEIWRKSNGNPRLILLLCATMFDLKS